MSPPSTAHPAQSHSRAYKRSPPQPLLSTQFHSPHLSEPPPPLAGASGAAARRNWSRSSRGRRRRAPLISTTPSSATTAPRLAVVFQFVCPPRRPCWSPGTPPVDPHRAARVRARLRPVRHRRRPSAVDLASNLTAHSARTVSRVKTQ